jgi:hypothetical protein
LFFDQIRQSVSFNWRVKSIYIKIQLRDIC